MIGLILAAGRSSRLGEPKILFKYLGKSLLERTCQQALSVCSEILVLIGAETEKSSEILLGATKCQTITPQAFYCFRFWRANVATGGDSPAVSIPVF